MDVRKLGVCSLRALVLGGACTKQDREAALNELLSLEHSPLDERHGREWKEVPGYPGYQISSDGVLRKGHLHIRGTLREGYWSSVLTVKGGRKPVLFHRLVASAFIGEIPPGFVVDHIDGNPTNNLVSNLRIATQSENAQNKRLQSNNTSGFPGVTKCGHKWRARLRWAKKNRHLGFFIRKQDAIEAVKKERVRLSQQSGFPQVADLKK